MDGKTPRQVWESNAEYQKFFFGNFEQNFKALKKALKKMREIADSDDAALLRDMEIHRNRAGAAQEEHTFWEGSNAQALLEEAVTSDTHRNIKPKQLWESRPEYQEFLFISFETTSIKRSESKRHQRIGVS